MLAALGGNSKKYQWLISKCSDQSSFARVERKSIGVTPMTLNTYKKYAEDNIQGGFQEIERVRKKLKNKYIKPLPKSTETGKSIDNYKQKLEKAERARAILIRAYVDLNSICLDAISRSPEFQYDFNRHKKLYETYFKLALTVDNE